MNALPYNMFDLQRSAADARRYERAANIYHRGQDLAWDGREVLAELVKKHGGPQVPAGKQQALHAVLGPILWGELAAWKISAQLADQLVPLEAKMAATSQAHDEARHFYVMHDYLLLATGSVPKSIPPNSEKLLGLVLETDDIACKLMGMQLQVETTALTLFQHIRERRICPVLTDLLLYYEKDEARHVGLGTQCLPMILKRMNRRQAVRFSAFSLQVMFFLIASNRAMEGPLVELGLDPRRLLQLAKSKQQMVWDEVWGVSGQNRTTAGSIVSRVLESAANAMWPPPGQTSIPGRTKAFLGALINGVDMVETSITPEPAPPPAQAQAAE
jgi:hypothetical protein